MANQAAREPALVRVLPSRHGQESRRDATDQQRPPGYSSDIDDNLAARLARAEQGMCLSGGGKVELCGIE
jgi:hypothetical protein